MLETSKTWQVTTEKHSTTSHKTVCTKNEMEPSINLLIISQREAVSRKKDEKAWSMFKYIRLHGFHAGRIAQW